MNQPPTCAACGKPLAAVDAICACEETRTAAAAAAQSALEARAARGRIYVCPSCSGHFSRADLMARLLFDPLRRRFGLPWPRLSCPHCATELRSRHAMSMLFHIAALVWLAGLPLYLFTGLPELKRPALLAGWFAFAVALAVQHWRESRDPLTYEAIPPK